MKFIWDERKNEINKIKHGISFEQAKEIYMDPLHLALLDERFGYFEERWITIGKTADHHIVLAVNLYFDEDGEEVIRIILARNATNHERSQYERK